MNVWYKMSIDNLTLVLFGICLDLCEHSRDLEAKLDGVLDFEGVKFLFGFGVRCCVYLVGDRCSVWRVRQSMARPTPAQAEVDEF